MKAERFFVACEKQSLFTFEFKNLTRESLRKLPCGFDTAFFKLLCCVQVYLREETLQPTQVALTKMARNKARLYQETDFLSTEGHLTTSSGCFLTLTCSLDVVQVRFVFVAFCL